jgi:hypothetical protein
MSKQLLEVPVQDVNVVRIRCKKCDTTVETLVKGLKSVRTPCPGCNEVLIGPNTNQCLIWLADALSFFQKDKEGPEIKFMLPMPESQSKTE